MGNALSQATAEDFCVDTTKNTQNLADRISHQSESEHKEQSDD